MSLRAEDFLPGLDATLRQALLAQAGTTVCDVEVYRIRYDTVGAQGEATHASGALMVPHGTASRCAGRRPLLVYAHGTATDVAFDMTRLDVAENAEGIYLAAFFATQGYIVVAPNYAGYDGSSLPYHPYLVAASAVAQGATDRGREAVLEAYHGALVSTFCLEAAREFFESR